MKKAETNKQQQQKKTVQKKMKIEIHKRGEKKNIKIIGI